ncbi:CdiA C-terminal domain-containing protein [Streptomyces brevispora]|uniref:CdiA C-terminal domain-containing protein n=1 Tax=Streptomyces brevispora TaxID=887462 RepID=UPI00382DBA51
MMFTLANRLIQGTWGQGVTSAMTAAAVWGLLQLFLLSWPTRSVRLSTVLLTLMVGVYVCGVATALIQLAYTRVYANQSGHPLVEVVNTTSYTVAPWVEELVKISPLLLAGLSFKVRLQWGLADFVVLGAALGGGFGLLESLLRFGLDANRAIPAADGGWIIPDSLSPPYVPGWSQVFTAWLPAPFGQSDLSGPPAAETFSHLVWSALAGLGVGLLWRTRGRLRLLSFLPVAAASAYHGLNNYVSQISTGQAAQWLETLNAWAWTAPLVCLGIAMGVDLRQTHRGKRTVPGVLLATERADGDSVAALLRYAAWYLPWSLLIALRYIRLRRSLFYASALAPPDETEPLRRTVAKITAQMDASDHQHAWRADAIRTRIKAARPPLAAWRKWLLLIPCVLMLPAVLFLGIGSFTSTAKLQEFFATGPGPRILMGFGVAALAWIVWQLIRLIRSWGTTSAQILGELLAVHRFRIGTALGAATTGTLLLYRGFGEAGPEGKAISTFHLLDALGTFAVYLGFALILLSLLALFPPGGLALAASGAAGVSVGVVSAEAAINAALLGTAGIALMTSGAGFDGGESTDGPERTLPERDPEPSARPKGDPERIPTNARSETRRALTRQNEAADKLAQKGYDVENAPEVPGSRNPDYRINGKIFDCYAPSGGNARNIASEMQKKIEKRQTERIVLNLSDSSVDLAKMRAQLHDWPTPGLKEVISIDKFGNILHLFP